MLLFGGQRCNSSVISNAFESQEGRITSPGHDAFISSGHQGFVLQCPSWRIIPEARELLVTRKAPSFLLAIWNTTGILVHHNHPLPCTNIQWCWSRISFVQNHWRGALGQWMRCSLTVGWGQMLLLRCSKLAKEKQIPRSSDKYGI